MQLVGTTVLVCRQAEQSAALAAELTKLGASVVVLPLVQIVPPLDGGTALATTAAVTAEFDWVVFTSANGVRAFQPLVTDWPESTRVAVVGEATESAARQAGLAVSFKPKVANAKSLAEELPIEEGERRRAARVLAPLAELAGPHIQDGLTARGADVTVVTAYRSVVPHHEAALLAAAAAADAVLLTSGSTVQRLVAVLGLAAVPSTVIAIGQSTADAAEHQGLKVAPIANPHNQAGLIDALVRTLGQ